jgi:hypothetical protein
MSNKIVFMLALILMGLNHDTGAVTKKGKQEEKFFREICGYRFSDVGAVKMKVRRISPDSLRNRIDNERYNACPYKIVVSYLGIPVNLYFGQSVTLDAIERWDEYPGVNTGVFEYSRDGWVAPFDNPTISQSDINVKNRRNGVVVSGIFSRIGSLHIKSDYCFGLSAVNKDGFLTAMECRPTRRELLPINDLFKNSTVISFPKAAPLRSNNAKPDLCGSTSDCVY